MYNGLALVEVDNDIVNAPDWYVRKNTLAMYENDIKKELSKINDSFAYIGMKLSEIQQYGLYTSLSITDSNGTVRACNNVAEWALAVLDISKSTTYNLIGVYERFCRSDGFIAESMKKYSFSQLCEMLRTSYTDFDKMGFDPCMTCREIRERIRSFNGVSLDVKTEKAVEKQVSAEVLPNQMEMQEVEATVSQETSTVRSRLVEVSQSILMLLPNLNEERFAELNKEVQHLYALIAKTLNELGKGEE